MRSIPILHNVASPVRILIATTLLLVAGPAVARAQAGGIAVGASAPGAAVTTLSGGRADLADYIGKTPVILEFWATWCPVCKELEPAVAAARKKYAGHVTFVSVGVADNQSAARQQAYAKVHGIKGIMVFDGAGHAVKAYAAPHTSYIVAIDRSGTVVYTGVGGDQDIDGIVKRATAAPNGG